jgi:hypothetical protein
MLAYPNHKYKRHDKVVVYCDSGKNPHCRKKLIISYWRHKANMDRNNGMYLCNQCVLTERYGVINQRFLADDLKDKRNKDEY